MCRGASFCYQLHDSLAQVPYRIYTRFDDPLSKGATIEVIGQLITLTYHAAAKA